MKLNKKYEYVNKQINKKKKLNGKWQQQLTKD